ncbi:MAG TPA: alpha/beta hydrolase, partial [Rhodospirillaceae bacterium]|nr:alpha/beta hydrolase [Rhodospirillaceae bacterium]
GTSMGGLIGMSIAVMAGHPIKRLLLNDVGPYVPKEALQRIGDYVGIPWRFDSF